MTTRLLPWLFVLVMAVGPLWLGDQYILYVLTSTGIFIIGAMSLNLLLGYTGQLSLGHIAFFGIGAYTSALLSLGFDLDLGGAEPFVLGPQPVWVAFLGGILVAALFGFLIGKLAFRVRGAYFVIVTISFAQVMRMVALNWVDLTEGPMALNNIPPLSVWLPWDGVIPLYRKEYNYLLVLAVAVVCFLVIQRLVQSRVGRALVALRENESLARSVGIDVTRYLVVATVIAAGMAGAAGGLYTHYIRIVDPDVFMFIYTVTMVIMVVTGGKGTLAGPIVGGLAFGILPEVLREVARPEVQWIIYGVAMIVVVFFLPQGIVPAVKNWFAGRRKRVAATALGLRKETSA
ncbi:branched-chain amino acid ABC transporter permease (plasmid) [Azospirillum sp. TSH58]|uniref:branched-chain amino acid ABC transporter permease n=1 Tax=Azospirillum sp. TSH58 TaxID=664962 RepID=UPI000D601AA3|nr:branched-chain amino acid ABC transporter permease [Azospirillum sp. TSH58]AWJ85736.1 branched-chain amino acid ABC transporter permease [Azospirillum sp. TSH58]PWC73349.1 ABC transporter permease [Azospirillum sp. TSH58]